MKRNLVLVLIAVIAVVLAAFMLMQRQAVAPAPPAANEEVPASAQSERTFSWRFATTESDDGMPPRTQVDLITDGDVYDAGAYAGSCAEVAAENLLPNEVSGVVCWWAGGGDEIAIFKEGGRYVLKHGLQEESTAESDGFRGNFTELAVIE